MKLKSNATSVAIVQVADTWVVIKAIMDAAEHGSIWNGFLCEECATEIGDEQ